MSRLNLTLNAGRRVALRLLGRFGANGALGAALVLVAAGGFWYAQLAHEDSQRLATEAAAARARAAQVKVRPEDLVPAGERLAQFQKWFPSSDTATGDLRKIFAAARDSHVDLARGEYAMTPIDGSGGLQKYDVIFPLKEHYAPIKSFVAAVLNELPHASLIELRVERPASAADEVDTRVHFTLYYRNHTT